MAYSDALSIHTGAIADADDAYLLEIDPYEVDVVTAEGDVMQAESAVAAIEQNLTSELAARASAYAAALATFEAGVADAQDDLDSAIAAAQATYDAAMAQPNADWEAAESAAWAIYLAAKEDADENEFVAYQSAEASAWATYASAIAALEAQLADDEADVIDTYSGAVAAGLAAALADWETAEADAWDTYTTAIDLLPGPPAAEDRVTEAARFNPLNALAMNGPEGVGLLLAREEAAQQALVPYVVTSIMDGGNGSLRAGIARGNAAGQPFTIRFRLPANQTTINLTTATDGSAFALTNSFTIEGFNLSAQGQPTETKVTIQRSTAAGTPNFRIFSITQAQHNTINISNLTIKNGAAVAAQGAFGGAINNFVSSTLNLYQVTFENNRASSGGGALANYGTLTVENCTFTQNQAAGDASGGAIYNSSGGQAWILETRFVGNQAQYGGAISNSGQMQIFSSDIDDNRARGFGGGIATGGDSGSLSISGGRLHLNEAGRFNDSGFAGGMHVGNGTVTLLDVSVTQNRGRGPNGNDGGIHVVGGTLTLVSGNTVQGNTTPENQQGVTGIRRIGGQLNLNENDNNIVDDVVQ